MAKKTIYRTLITLVVLSEEELDENQDLESIIEECDTGAYLKGCISFGKPRPLKGKTAVIEIEKAGSDAGFFNMDTLGNDLEEEEEEDETKDSAFDSFIDSADMPQ
jgi:hypothetical protein